MQVRHIIIKHFRGIEALTWSVPGHFICLVGPGDSTKSTILEAIDLTLSPRWAISFDDSDFYRCDTTHPIVIIVTVGSLPKELLTEQKYGRLARGWDPSTRELHDEPSDADELVLSVRLTVDDSLEPKWTIFNDRISEEVVISARDREKFGACKIGSYVDRHLTWSRGSILARITEKDTELARLLASVARDARSALAANKSSKLTAAGKAVAAAAKTLGVKALNDYSAELDGRAIEVGISGLSLHDGNIPVRLHGLGTRRLVALAIQREASKEGAMTLIDEVEHGLEPHRVRRLLQALRESVQRKGAADGQVLFTTHSAVAVHELRPSELFIVRSDSGVTTVSPLGSSDLQTTIRLSPEAFLASKVIVCEGATEVGLLRGVDISWVSLGNDAFACLGVALVDGDGDSAPKRARQIGAAGFETMLFRDSDKPLKESDKQQLVAANVEVLEWTGNMETERRFFLDAPWSVVLAAVKIAIEEYGEKSVRDSLNAKNATIASVIAESMDEWQESVLLREVLGAVASKRQWFKRIDLGENLGVLLRDHLDVIKAGDMFSTLAQIRKWIDKA